MNASPAAPGRWQGRASFTHLALGFGSGGRFLATLSAWMADPERPRRLHWVAIEPHPVAAAEIARTSPADPLAHWLAAQGPLVLPGVHRVEFPHEACTAVLTLCVGEPSRMLRDLVVAADAVSVDEPPADLEPAVLARSLARLMRPDARVVAPAGAGLDRALGEAGFTVSETDDGLDARYAPRWPRPASWPDNCVAEPRAREAVVIGAGLAGACVAHALACRGWAVTVLDGGPGAASGASGLPAGLMVPHVSPDDAPMSRLTRAGAALMRRWIEACGLSNAVLHRGVLQHVDDAHRARAPSAWGGQAGTLFTLQNAPTGPARFFPDGLAVSPARLVPGLLASHRDIATRWQARAAALEHTADGWRVHNVEGETLACAPVVVVASALDSLRIARPDAAERLRAVRGQLTLGRTPVPTVERPAHPLSGDGHFIALPDADLPWLMGASFERGETSPAPTAESTAEAHAGNLAKLRRLAPDLAASLAADFDPARAQAWAQVRCMSPDRLPLVGQVPGRDGVHLLAALGSRGLSLAAICAELLASQLEGEPWPVEASLGASLSPARFID